MSREPMTCEATEPGRTCPCSWVTATGGKCGVFGPLPTFAEAFPYLPTTRRETEPETNQPKES